MSSVHPTATELADLGEACEKLWDLDENRLQPGVHFQLNLQNGKRAFEQGDAAMEPLFSQVDIDTLKRTPTIATFVALLDNYNATAGHAEVCTDAEIAENRRFIDQICKTTPMQYLHNYLIAKHLAPVELNEFKSMIYDIWFKFYRRVTNNDSSAFEHCFVGERREDKGVIGFHNWIMFLREERARRVDYRGFVYPKHRCRRRTMEQNSEHILCIQLSWKGEIKPVSTFMIGCSPEFEIALYTLAFLCGTPVRDGSNHGPDPIEVRTCFDDVDVTLKVHRFQARDGMKLGSVYIEIGQQ